MGNRGRKESVCPEEPQNGQKILPQWLIPTSIPNFPHPLLKRPSTQIPDIVTKNP